MSDEPDWDQLRDEQDEPPELTDDDLAGDIDPEPGWRA